MATTGTVTNVIEHRHDFVLVFDVVNGNPNGDPDAGNAPRTDPETGHGLVSDVCLKRKVRNFITLAKRNPQTGEPEAGYDIYVKHGGILLAEHEKAFAAPGVKLADDKHHGDAALRARAWMCQTYYDIRAFGAVLSVGQKRALNCGQVRGPVQITFARSVDPIASLEQSITRVAVTTPEKAQQQIDEKGAVYSEMGRKEIIPYALYVAHGFVSPNLAADTRFCQADLDLLWTALMSMFELDHSAARGEMATRKLIVFEHESHLGNAPAHALFERITIERKDQTKPPRCFTDYAVKLNRDGLPAGITVHEMV
ncbi:MAG: type I-C CRISPR-associated protein Cas7/Csd2 [Planctomycetes bacterium]|nr:type I-C CRISPR-associated protein Cas7/Csd2 [Planctomycetota bacterium]